MNPGTGKPSFALSDGGSFIPKDADWLEHLARRVFVVEAESKTFSGADDEEKPFEDFGRFLFHLYNQRAADGTSSLEKAGPFGKAAAKFLSDVHRSFALMEAGIDLDSEECTGQSEEELEKTDKAPFPFRSKSEIHRAAATIYPYLFRGGYSPNAPNHETISRMWKAVRMAKIRPRKPWGNTSA
jgi:hypothetical protein